MNATNPNLSSQYSFSDFVWKLNRRYLMVGIIAGMIQIIVFKFLYPLPDFISDSYSYINTNLFDMKVNLWPVGYSIFIRFIHAITSSSYFLVFLQFWILQASLYYFYFTVTYLYPIKWRIILFIFLFFNPIFLYLSNCVLSDALFCALTLVLIAQYFWMFYKPSYSHIILQALLIGALFIIRYTAIYYPIVSIIAILFAGYRPMVKLIGMILPWILIIPFILYTQQQTKAITGTAEFSVFGGWQIANNALYMYNHIDVDSTKLPDGTQELNGYAKKFFKEHNITEHKLRKIEGTFFIKVPSAVLKPYMADHMTNDIEGAVDQFKAWGTVSPTYNKFGRYLITHYPIAFVRYYLWLNTQNYFFPYLEKFGFYNVGDDKVGEAVVTWFQLKDNGTHQVPSIYFQGDIFAIYPYAFMFLNVYFLFILIYFLIEKKWLVNTRFSNISILLAFTFIAVNFAFSVFATPVVLRYQIVPMIILVFFSIYLSQIVFEKKEVK
jgi:4-amino-4-deoxy-L-arabinose transferase-like glycosyltransferase